MQQSEAEFIAKKDEKSQLSEKTSTIDCGAFPDNLFVENRRADH